MRAQASQRNKNARRALQKLKHLDISNVLDEDMQPREVPEGRTDNSKARISEPDEPIKPLEEHSNKFLVALEKLVYHAPSLGEAKSVLRKQVEHRRSNMDLNDGVRLAREALVLDVDGALEELRASSGKAQGKRRAESPLEEPRKAPARKKVRFSLAGEDGEQLVLPSDPLDDVADGCDDGVPGAQRRKSAALATKLLVDCLNALQPYPPAMKMLEYEIIPDELVVSNIALAISEVQISTRNLEGIARCEDLVAALSTVNKLEEKAVDAFAEWEERHVASRAKSIFQVLQRDNGLVLADDLKARFQSRAF